MDYVTLGRTGLQVSVAGLGCGGFSQLGLAQGKSEADAIAIIRQALELGVNLFDTAAAYGTEGVLGKAIKSVRREEVVVCTKAPFSFSNPHSTPEGIVASLDKSLRQLDTDYIDVYQLHGVPPAAYDHAAERSGPGAAAGEGKGQVPPSRDYRNRAPRPRAPDIKSGSTGRRLGRRDGRVPHDASECAGPGLSADPANRVGTLLMFAVRNIFSQPERLRATVRDLAAAGEVPQSLADTEDPLEFLIHEGGASTVPDAAYRFVRHEPGVDVVLFGTGDPEHLRTNIASILKPPLPAADSAQLSTLFGHLVGVGLDAPHLARPRR